MSKVSQIIKESSKSSDKKFARDIRVSILKSMIKIAEHGILHNMSHGPDDYPTREHYTAERGGTPEKELYGVGLKDHKNSDISVEPYSRSLSTRYSPDRVGVQALRVSDGVVQDPITNKIYDWKEGFKTEDGEVFDGSSVSLQTDIMYRG